MLLERIDDGDELASEDLLPLVYDELRELARRLMNGSASSHTLQPTALVHEAYAKLVGNGWDSWKGHAHFCAVASSAMRQILLDHARSKRAVKRGGGVKHEGLTGVESPPGLPAIDLLVLDDALTRLAEADERGTRVFELRYFGGMGQEQIATLLGCSTATVDRDWRRCKAWITSELTAGDG
ncbi:MAG: ECF-type sigma factor [Planctomycetota bacterium]